MAEPEPNPSPPPQSDRPSDLQLEQLAGMAASNNSSDPFSRIIDDTDGRDEAVQWTAAQLIAGKSFEAVTDELVSLGWAIDVAGAIVEEAREATRRQRGIRTRDDVAGGVSRKFTKTMRRVRWLIIIGIIAVAIVIGWMMNQA